MVKIDNLTENRINYLKGIANYFDIEYSRVRALSLTFGESGDDKLIAELDYIKDKRKIEELIKE